MTSQEYKGTVEVMVKEEKAEDGDTAAVFSDHDMSIREAIIKQECARVTSTDPRYFCNNPTDLSIKAHSSHEVWDNRMNSASSSQNQCHSLDFENSSVFSIKKEKVIEEDSSSIFPKVEIDIHETDIKKEYARVVNMDTVDCDTPVISNVPVPYDIVKSDDKINIIHQTTSSEKKKQKHKQKQKKHEKIQSDEKTYSCSICEKTFIKKGYLKVHERTHSGEKPYSCGNCGDVFSHKCSLMRHMRIHSGEKPYSCAECEKKFSHKSTLIDHEKIHSGEKPYSCEDCGKQFSRRSHFTEHNMIHSGEKPYSCGHCGKNFINKGNFIRHEKIHKTYVRSLE